MTRDLVAYWQERHPGRGGMPRWSAFELMDLYWLADSISVKDVVDGGADFRNRYWGSLLTVALGFEGTAMRVSEYEPQTMREAVMRRYKRMVKTGDSAMARGYISTMPGKEHLPYEFVHLPLWGEKDEMQHIISVYHFGFVMED